MWNEIIYILMMASGVILFPLGGTEIPFVKKGYKWFRRFVYPFVMFILAFWFGMPLWANVACSSLLCAALHLGYGGTKPYWYKFLVGVAYALPSLFFGFSLWVILTPVIFLALFALSNWQKTSGSFIWKIVEGAIGFCVSATIISALHNIW